MNLSDEALLDEWRMAGQRHEQVSRSSDETFAKSLALRDSGNRTKRFASTGVLALVLALTLLGVGLASHLGSHPTASRFTAAAGHRQADCVPNTEGSHAELFSQQVMTQGSATYLSAFGGASITDCSVLNVYAVPSSPQYEGLIQMVQTDSKGSPYNIVSVSNSLYQLKAAAGRAASWSEWKQLGFRVAYAAPNVRTNRVDVVIAPIGPSSQSMAREATAGRLLSRRLGPLAGVVDVASRSERVAPA